MKIPTELIGKEIRYSRKIDYSWYIGGYPQYHRIVEMRGPWGWAKIYDQRWDKEQNCMDWKEAESIRDFISFYGQLKRTPNGVGQVDVEGSMVFSNVLISQYNKTH